MEKSIGYALALFGEDLDEALEPDLQEVGYMDDLRRATGEMPGSPSLKLACGRGRA